MKCEEKEKIITTADAGDEGKVLQQKKANDLQKLEKSRKLILPDSLEKGVEPRLTCVRLLISRIIIMSYYLNH